MDARPEGSWERFIKLLYFTGKGNEESKAAGCSTQEPCLFVKSLPKSFLCFLNVEEIVERKQIRLSYQGSNRLKNSTIPG